jgi:hypothetical protein
MKGSEALSAQCKQAHHLPMLSLAPRLKVQNSPRVETGRIEVMAALEMARQG